jgi:Dolichyl-phosphate-mannose-protein mannosyltransferase
MGRFVTRERFGRPQVLASLLLLVFLAQCGWLVMRGTPDSGFDPVQLNRLARGLALWRSLSSGSASASPPVPDEDGTSTERKVQPSLAGGGFDANHSPLWYLIASAPLLATAELWTAYRPTVRELRFLAALPQMAFGLLLGASIWYVARRLFGNAGGYVALALYCFSPAIIRGSAVWSAEPEVGAAWGAFGAIFTAIAVAHTLYAPREVILWNWRRIILLGLSLALAVGLQFSLVIVLPAALGFMLYLAPGRRIAATIIWAVACAIAALLLFAAYFFQPRAFWPGMTHASFFHVSWKALAMPQAWHQVLAQLGQTSPALVVALPIGLITYCSWPRARYFGNTAPLLVGAPCLVLALGSPHYPGLGFQLIAVPFLFVFVAGIAADWLETRHREIALAGVWGLLLAAAVWNLWELVHAGRG